MKKNIIYFSVVMILAIMLDSCSDKSKAENDVAMFVSTKSVKLAKDSLINRYGEVEKNRIEKGVDQCARFWDESDGNDSIFVNYCIENFATSGENVDAIFDKLCFYFETIKGNYNVMTIDLMRNLHEPKGEITKVDEVFGGYDASSHFQEDMFKNKIAFLVLLNFPHYTLAEKNSLGVKWSPRQWGMARMGDVFTSRVPSDIIMNVSQTIVDADNYISAYNIYMGNIKDEKGNFPFPKDMVLLSHWNLRDELKSHYGEAEGIVKQEIIYKVMERIIDQSIPKSVVNNPDNQWDLAANRVFSNGKEISNDPEPDTRYMMLQSNFFAMKKLDPYTPFYKTAIERAFDENLEISQADVEKMFIDFVSSKTVADLGKLISKRLGRNLRPYDIWYDGFKSRSGLSEVDLDKTTQAKYPNNFALKSDLPNILVKLGFDNEKANYISSFIDVDPARGSGHAWGAEMKSATSHLRTRIAETGMNYKGYNIAIHEFGHNVEQTISLHDVDNYMIHGVPNTAFTEALAFVFQKRDLNILGVKDDNKLADEYKTLDICWGLYEIMGVSLVDMEVWKWMYKNPNASPTELKVAVIDIAKDIWNKYYAPVFGVKDSPILAIYSHSISNPLYLAAYPLGHIIEFQIEELLKDKKLSEEVLRLYSIGRITPNVWMEKACKSNLSTKMLEKSTSEAIKNVQNIN